MSVLKFSSNCQIPELKPECQPCNLFAWYVFSACHFAFPQSFHLFYMFAYFMMIVNITLLSSSSHWLGSLCRFTSATIPFDSTRLFLLFIFFYSLDFFFRSPPNDEKLLCSSYFCSPGLLFYPKRQLLFGWMTSERNKCDNIKLDFRLSSVVFQLILLQLQSPTPAVVLVAVNFMTIFVFVASQTHSNHRSQSSTIAFIGQFSRSWLQQHVVASRHW